MGMLSITHAEIFRVLLISQSLISRDALRVLSTKLQTYSVPSIENVLQQQYPNTGEDTRARAVHILDELRKLHEDIEQYKNSIGKMDLVSDPPPEACYNITITERLHIKSMPMLHWVSNTAKTYHLHPIPLLGLRVQPTKAFPLLAFFHSDMVFESEIPAPSAPIPDRLVTGTYPQSLPGVVKTDTVANLARLLLLHCQPYSSRTVSPVESQETALSLLAYTIQTYSPVPLAIKIPIWVGTKQSPYRPELFVRTQDKRDFVWPVLLDLYGAS